MDLLTSDKNNFSYPTKAVIGGEIGAQRSVLEYVSEAIADSTRRAYSCDIVHFLAWGGSLPATPDIVARYLAEHGGRLAAATLTRRLAAITRAHRARGFESPCSAEIVRAVFRGIKRTHGVAQSQARPLLVDDLKAILDRMGTGPKDLRDRALLLLGFSGALRRSELVALNFDDLENTPQGLILHIRRSKTDPTGAGRKIGIPLGRSQYCAVEAVRQWLVLAGISEGAIFRPINRHGHIATTRLSSHAIAVILKARVALLSYDPESFSGHSLRSGLSTSAAMAGIPSWIVRKQTGHRTDAMLARYIRDGQLFRDNAAGGLL